MRGVETERWTPDVFRHLEVSVRSSMFHVVRGGRGPRLVLLAGWPQTWIAWRHLLEPLSNDFDVIAIELRGQGHSSIVDGPYDTATAAADVMAVLDWLGVDRSFIVGHDVGAWVTFTLLRDYEQRLLGAGLLDAAIPGLVAPTFFSPANAAKIWQFYFHAQPELATALVEGKEAVYLGWYFHHKCFTDGAIPADVIAAYVAAYSRPRAMWAGFRWYADLAGTIAATSVGPERRFGVPTFALGGEHATGDLLHRSLLPFCDDLHGVVAPCGHYIPEEAPQAVLDCIRTTFRRE